MHTKTFAILDTETTGFSPQRWDKLIEIAVVKMKNMKIDSSTSFSTLLDPQRSIPLSATRVNKITNDMVVGQPLIEDKIDEFIDFFHDVDFTLIHNAKFDLWFLYHDLKRLGKDFKLPWVVCTVELSRHLYPDYNTHNLDALWRRFWVEVKPWEWRHRALWDVIMTWEVFLKLYEQNPMIFLSELEQLSKREYV